MTNPKRKEKIVGISHVAESQTPAFNPWLIWFPAALFYCYQFILRVSPSVMEHDLMKDFAIDGGMFGLLASFYYFGYCAFQIPLGLMADYFGPRKLLTFAALLCAFATIIFATSTNIYLAGLARFFIGAGSSCAFLGSMKLGTLWFPAKRLPLITGATIFLGTMGANLGGKPLRLLSNSYDWRTSLLIVAGFGVLIGATIWFVSRDESSNNKTKSSDTKNGPPVFEGLKMIFATPQVWLGSLYGFMLYAPLSVFADLWGTGFIEKTYKIPTAQASEYVNYIYIGLAIGALLYAWMVEKFMKITTGLTISTLGVGIPFIVLLLVPDLPLNVMLMLLFTVGVMIGGQFLSFSFTCSHMPVHFSGVTIGITNMVTMLSGLVFQPIIGMILDNLWKGEMKDGVRVFEASDYRSALLVVPICVIIAFIISLFLKEKSSQYINKNI